MRFSADNRRVYLVFFGYAAILQSRPSAAHLNFLVIMVSNAVGIGAETTQPGFSVALDDMAAKYPSLYRNYTVSYVSIIPPGPDPCFPAAFGLVSQRISELYGSGEFAPPNVTQIILSAACSLPFAIIADFAREEDILTVSCGPAEFENADFLRWPTTMVTYAGSAVLTGLSLTILADMFHWRTVAFLLDTVSVRVTNSMQSLIGAFQKRASDFSILITAFSSGDPGGNPYPAALRKSGEHSRIIIVMTIDGFIRKIMADAVRLGMTSGYYLFIYFYSIQTPFEPPIMWKHRHDQEPVDQEVLQAMDSVLVLRFVAMDYSRWSEQMERIQRRRAKLFGHKPDPEMRFSEVTLGCYESLEILSQVVNESSAAVPAVLWSARRLAHHVSGRTFSLPHRNVSFTSEGRRIPAFVLQQFNQTMGDFEDVMNYDPISAIWMNATRSGLRWKSGKPPQDCHPCGYHNDLCATSSNVTLVVPLAAGLVLLIVLTIASIFIRCHPRPADVETWWQLDGGQLGVCKSVLNTLSCPSMGFRSLLH